MTPLRRIALTAVAAPLALALAACGSDEQAAEGPPTGEPIAHVAPPAGTSWAETATVTPEDGYRIGNPDAPLKLVEYASPPARPAPPSRLLGPPRSIATSRPAWSATKSATRSTMRST